MGGVHKITLNLKAGEVFDPTGFLSSCLDEVADAFSMDKDSGVWMLEWIFETAPDSDVVFPMIQQAWTADGFDSVPDLRVDTLPDIDWVAHVYSALEPFSVGAFFVFGSHARRAAPDGLIGMEIEAATAFGSGTHGTTGGCLVVLSELKARGLSPQNILDVGTGSGILAIGAAKLWPEARVAGSDIDEECIRVSRVHAGVNDAPDIHWIVADGMDHPELTGPGPYDLVMANILAGPLIDMAKDIAGAVAPGGTLILSGLLETQIDKVSGAYETSGLSPRPPHISGEWAVLTFTR